MEKIILTSIIISLIITAIYATTWPGMIFHNPTSGIKDLLEAKKIGVVYKPLFGCLICMSSFWTFIAWLISMDGFHLIWVMLCVAGINTIITALIKDIIPDEM
ncbi:hypothetical protein [Proteiniphilum sp. X52]|uniref:hypothetical protein n=1 Tax=Proteiniphilum sp. X52 TaxID=2382159 RepID=UPI000F09BBF8|nr:hypothetical protein [Proteiniphilum sp. X52]RNC66462.1 hypothetical protein D7D25_03000 [Proteiniphilum sp. X52]